MPVEKRAVVDPLLHGHGALGANRLRRWEAALAQRGLYAL